MLGNLDQLCQHSEMWGKVRSILSEQNSIISQVDMKCDTHGNVTTVSERKDFEKSPLGGCNTICGLILNCSHPCSKMCHYLNQRHKCDNLCEKMCKNNHLCQKLCDELCGLCETPVEITLDCGHETSVRCHVRREDVQCQEKTNINLPCGHSLTATCLQ